MSIKSRLRVPVLLAAASLTSIESHAQNAVTDWTAIASTTIVANGGKPSATSSVWFAYASIAVYDAVNAVHREFQPFYYKGHAPRGRPTRPPPSPRPIASS